MPDMTTQQSAVDANPRAFPTFNEADMAVLRKMGASRDYTDGEVIFHAGQDEIDLFVVETGGIEVINPAADDAHIVTHGPGQFAGDIDLLTRRPVIVTGIARGPNAKLLCVPGSRLREVLNKVPQLGEKMLIAIQERRRLLTEAGVLGLRVVGPTDCRDTMVVREFLFKNFVPHHWYESRSEDGKRLMEKWGSPKRSPVVQLSDGKLLIDPSLRDLADAAGIWRDCPLDTFDMAIIGGGPAGMTAAVYAASEGVSTIVLDRLGPGGQAAGSSKIENFIGFPSGLSGAELATRGVLQMLKFGAQMIAPVTVQKLEAAAGPEATHLLHLDCGTILKTRAVLIAAGVRWRKLEATGAERFESAGIHYACTTVEAMLYDNSDVAVVGAGNSAGQAAMFLAECCQDRTVHMLVRKRLGPGMSDYLVGRIRGTKNIVVHEGVQIDEVHGSARLESVTIKGFHTTDGSRTNVESEQNLKLSAVFVFIGAEPGCSWLPEGLARDPLGYLLTGIDALRSGQWPLTDREPCPLETTIPGILAAGDIRSGSTKRVGFAVGDGSLAVTCVHRLLANLR